MSRARRTGATILAAAVAAGLASCSSNPDRETLAQLHRVEADTAEVAVDDSLELAMQSYRRFLQETPESTMAPEAMRRLADLQIEQQFGIEGTGEIVELPAYEVGAVQGITADGSRPAAGSVDGGSEGAVDSVSDRGPDRGSAGSAETDEAFEARATSQFDFAAGPADFSEAQQLSDTALSGPLEAIEIYQRILEEYPSYERADQVLYQMARAYDEIGRPDEAMDVMERLVGQYGYSDYLDEVHFRRGEYLFTRRQFREAEGAYEAIIAMGSSSSYYELALYKLGWALYKQEFYDLALHRFMALLDHKLAIGYDFDQTHEEDEERRVADTFRVISLSFSNLGGPEVINEYFADNGVRSYEDRIYANLGEFYLEKLRYHDAAEVYASFVDLYPYHRVSPQFSMRIVDIYDQGGFPILVVESKKDFATKYGLQSEYWDYFDSAETPEVLSFLKTNLTDLANHYHALYQEETLVDERPQNFAEASQWYREFLTSFPADPESPSINYQLADLLLENDDFGPAALEYERTAYEYEPHERASEAGYAAIFAHREHLKVVDEFAETEVKRATVDSSLRFAEVFPDHEHAPVVLGAAADDLYDLNDFEMAIVAGTMLIERYPASEPTLLRAAWTVVAHSSFELGLYPESEQAYANVLRFVPEDDEEHASLVDNLAASIYQQGEQANELQDFRAAADHFLRIRDAAPTSTIRSSAEYDAAAALIRLEDWKMAGDVLEDFRAAFPEHELNEEATRQLASVYRQAGALDRSASEYERVAAEAEDPLLQQEALLLAGELYEEASQTDSALGVYLRYIDAFPYPLDMAQETRFKVAGMYDNRGDVVSYREMLQQVVDSDAESGMDRTDRSRFLAAQSALVLTQTHFDSFADVQLVQPFERNLAEKQQRMEVALQAFEGLVGYEVGEVTAAATYFIGEIYFEFSRSLLESERPTNLSAGSLADYELALEEEAFPFEERSIDVHEQNFALISQGVFNEWVQRSLDKLAVAMPGRYAKAEISGGYMGSIDFYAYRSPGAPALDGSEIDMGESNAQAR